MLNQKLKSNRSIGLTVFLSLFILLSCSKDDDDISPSSPSTSDYNRSSLLENYANAYIIPAYTEYKGKTASLADGVTNFNTDPTVATLQSLRTEWENALLVWQDVAFLEFGPASNISLRAQTNVYPARITTIDRNISTGDYNLGAGNNFAAKGFQAVDYLINGIGTTDQEIVDYFINSSNAKTYLQDIVDEIKNNASTVSSEWDNTYKTSFIANSASNAQGSSISNIVNAINLHYEAYMRKGKIGLPAGVFSSFSNQPMPSHVEAYYSETSLPYLYRSLNSLHTFINGNAYASNTTGEGLDDYLNFVNAQKGSQSLEDVINEQFNAIDLSVDNINDPLSNEVAVNKDGVSTVYQKMQEMVAYLKVDMTDALDVLITYQDTDGD
jgi:predicted lipoprotein